MSDDFNKFHKRMLVSAKEGAGLVTWFTIGIFAAFIYALVPAPDCLLPLSHDEDTQVIQESYARFCEGAYSAQISAMAWIGFSFLRIFFLTSKWQGGPILKSCGLKIETQDGNPISFGFAARYALIEWLPFHILSLYVLLFGMPTNLYGIGVSSIAVAAQLVWLAPVIFKYKGKNISEILTAGRAVFVAKKSEEIERSYKSNWKRKLNKTGFYFSNVFYALFAFFFLFTSIQILRTPPLNPDYERILYAGREPVWENNVYFAIKGLTAPADVQDSYAYGCTWALQRFKDFETVKKLAHIPYAYDIPDETGGLQIRMGQELKFNDENWKDLNCLYELNYTDSECATKEDFQSYIQAHQIIWDRFNNLPDYALYNVPPQLLGDHGSLADLMHLGQLKAVQIIEHAENGDPEKAFYEWYKYMTLYRSTAGARETLVFKAVIAIIINIHLKTFEKLLYLHPDIARNHAAEISNVLKPTGNTLFRTDQMLSDDIGLLEPSILSFLGNVNTVRNDVYDCILNFEKQAQMPLHKYPFGKERPLCSLDNTGRDASFARLMIHWFLQPGYFMSNIIYGLMTPGIVKGIELVGNFKRQDINLRMTLLAVAILRQGIAAENIPGFIASVPAELQNPVTQKPFEWDAEKKALFFIRPNKDEKVEFRLGL